MPSKVPNISVGILFSNVIKFRFNGEYMFNGTVISCGNYEIEREISFGKSAYFLKCTDKKNDKTRIDLPIIFTPCSKQYFELCDVTIGINFHWQRTENQKFSGSLKVIDEGCHLTAINVLPIDDYLTSVISSEMKATSPIELLKAHAIVSRTWLLAQIEKAKEVRGKKYTSIISDATSYIRWWDREDHKNFDVCADDHCQRYQGVSRATSQQVAQAVSDTIGLVLKHNGELCDTRFSKCCGGVTELFENTWENTPHNYLQRVSDWDKEYTQDLRVETNAREWIISKPQCFCNTTDKKVLSSILNDYDTETTNFFRWQVQYTTQEISELVKERTGIDFGNITDLVSIERGTSGRIIKLKIIGEKCSKIIGKELLIRKAFSTTHLYSSAFVVDKTNNGFILHGAGWGHGVGMCQIGAAVMASKGYSCKEILQHYFTECLMDKIY